MALKTLNIAITGCGPAGLSTALFLHRDGHRVTLFERFVTPHPLGSGLMIQPTGLAILNELGLAEKLIALAAPIHRIFGKNADTGRAVLNVSYAPLGTNVCGLGVHRAALFNILFDEVKRTGMTIETGRTITGTEALSGGQRQLNFDNGSSAGPFDLVVDALGARSPLAQTNVQPLKYGALWASLPWQDEVGFDEHALEQRYRNASVMAGVLPIGRFEPEGKRLTAFFWSIKIAEIEAWRSRGLEAWKADVAQIWPQTQPHLDQITSPDQLTVARYYHRTYERPYDAGLIHIGDSWHSASPQLGQGANMAMMDAFALALALRTHSLADALPAAIALRQNHVKLYQLMSALFTPFYQSDSRLLPLIRDWLVGPFSRVKPLDYVLSLMVSGQAGNPLKGLGLPTAPPRAGRDAGWFSSAVR